MELGYQIDAYRITNNAFEIVQMELGYNLMHTELPIMHISHFFKWQNKL
jgi:hypothetical protein